MVRIHKMDNNNINEISNKKIIYQLINLAIKHKKIMQNYLDETGVYHAQYRLLLAISHNENASQNDIAKLMDVSAATIAVSLKKLEKGGYINREIDEKDNRLNKINITEKGKKVVKQSKKIFEAVDQKVFQGITDEEKAALINLLQKLNNNLSKIEDELESKKERE